MYGEDSEEAAEAEERHGRGEPRGDGAKVLTFAL